MNCLQTSDRHKQKRGLLNTTWTLLRSSGNQNRKNIGLLSYREKRTNHLNREAYGLIFSGKHWKCNHSGQLKLNWTQTPEKMRKGSITSTVFCVELGDQISGVGFLLLLAKGYSVPELNSDLLFASTLPLSTQAPMWDGPCRTGVWHTCAYSTVQCKSLQAEPPSLTLRG